MNSIWEKSITHGEILSRIWKSLTLGAKDRRHAFHNPVFGTLGIDGRPKLRTVILRRYLNDERKLVFHTDIRARKIDQIKAEPNIEWLFYDAKNKLQLRVEATANVLMDGELYETQWENTQLLSRRCYMGEKPSGVSQKATSGMPEEIIKKQPELEESEVGKQNFAVVTTRINSIDCLELDFLGNRRSFFFWNESGELETKWLTP